MTASSPSQLIRILLADDHPVTREGLALILSLEEDIRVVAQAGDGEQTVAMNRKYLPDVVVLDLQMPRLNGLEATKQIVGEFPKAKILLFTTYDGDEDIYRAMHAGARGYVLKDAPQDELFRAIRSIHRGHRYLSPPVGAKLADAQLSESLTEREREVLRMVAAGKANKEISFDMGVSESTVKTHVASLIGKLGVSSRTEAALIAQKRGFLRD